MEYFSGSNFIDKDKYLSGSILWGAPIVLASGTYETEPIIISFQKIRNNFRK